LLRGETERLGCKAVIHIVRILRAASVRAE
jgi:hypothetical protein